MLLKELPDNLHSDSTSNMLNGDLWSRTVNRHIASLENNVFANSMYKNTNLTKILNAEIDESRKQSFQEFQYADVEIDTNKMRVESLTDKSSQYSVISRYHRHSYLDLYEDYFEPQSNIGDLCFLKSISPVGLRIHNKETLTLSVRHVRSEAGLNCSTVIVDVSNGANLTLIEDMYLSGVSLTNILYVVRENATLNLVRMYSNNDFGMIHSRIIQHPHSNVEVSSWGDDSQYLFESFDVTVHNDCNTNIVGRHFITNSNNNVTHVEMHHCGKNSSSNIDVKSVIDDQAFSSFRGNIRVDQSAEDTVAHMTNKNLQLSQRSTVFTEPMLDISTKEIECSHGCTISNIDQDELYYLQSRGADVHTAKQIIINGFLDNARIVPSTT